MNANNNVSMHRPAEPMPAWKNVNTQSGKRPGLDTAVKSMTKAPTGSGKGKPGTAPHSHPTYTKSAK